MILAAALILGFNGAVAVQDGISRGGMHWHMTARADHGRIMLGMDVRDYDGWFDDSPLDRRIVLFADHAEDIGSQDERLIDGYVYQDVAAVQVKTSTRTLTVHPRDAPPRALKRWPALEDVRFFVHFFTTSDVPGSVTALAKDGRALRTITFR